VLSQRPRLLLLRDHLRIRGERDSRIRIGNEGRGVRRSLLRVELASVLDWALSMHCSGTITERGPALLYILLQE
jgi:hypothetical protein